jgi:hypothetical protein
MALARERLRGHPEALPRLRKLGNGRLFEACAAHDEATIAALLAAALREQLVALGNHTVQQHFSSPFLPPVHNPRLTRLSHFPPRLDSPTCHTPSPSPSPANEYLEYKNKSEKVITELMSRSAEVNTTSRSLLPDMELRSPSLDGSHSPNSRWRFYIPKSE